MPHSIQVQCPAKVNLFLEVTGRRPDGYHTLATLFAKISLFDVLDLERTESKAFELELADGAGGLSAGPDNLVLRAAEAFRKAFRTCRSVRFRLTKRIPMGAGLGGGSSDAAGTMLGMARLFKMPLDRGLLAKLKKLAVGLGADVPFFVQDRALAEGRGIGERLKTLTPSKALPWMILVHPEGGIATKDVYIRLNRPFKASRLTRLSHLDTLKYKLEKGRPISEWGDLLFNRLEEAVLDEHEEVREAKDILNRLGLQGVLMSGSGASVFGFVPSHEEGESIRKRLQGYPWKVFLTCCLG